MLDAIAELLRRAVPESMCRRLSAGARPLRLYAQEHIGTRYPKKSERLGNGHFASLR